MTEPKEIFSVCVGGGTGAEEGGRGKGEGGGEGEAEIGQEGKVGGCGAERSKRASRARRCQCY